MTEPDLGHEPGGRVRLRGGGSPEPSHAALQLSGFRFQVSAFCFLLLAFGFGVPPATSTVFRGYSENDFFTTVFRGYSGNIFFTTAFRGYHQGWINY